MTYFGFLDDGTEEFSSLHLVDVFRLGVDVADTLLVEVLTETFHVVCSVLAAPVGVANENNFVG